MIAVAGTVFGQEAAQVGNVAQLGGMMGEESAAAVEGLAKDAREPARGVDATIVGIIGLLLGAAALFGQLQCALYRIWRVLAPKEGSGIWHLLRTCLLSFELALGVGYGRIVSLVLSAALAAVGKWLSGWFSGWEVFLRSSTLPSRSASSHCYLQTFTS